MSLLKGRVGWTTRKGNCRGFGLIEVVIAMAILSVMAGTLGPKLYESYQIRLVEKTGVEMHYIQEAAKNYRRDTGSWPANIAALQGAGYLPTAWAAKTPWAKPYTVSTNVTSFTVTVEMPPQYKNALGTYLPNVVVNGNNVSSSTPIPGSEPSLDALLPRDGSRPMAADLHMTGGDLKIEKDTPAIRLYNTAAGLGTWLKTLANGRLSVQTDPGTEIANIDQAGTLSASGLNVSGSSIVNTMTASSITTNSLNLVDGNTSLLRDTSGALFISTVNGSGVIGPMNSSYFHFSTDRIGFKFQQPIYLGGPVYGTSSSYYLEPSGTSLLNNLNVTSLNGGIPVQSTNIGSYTVTSIVPGSNIVVTGSTGPVTVGTVQNPYFTTSVTTPLLIDPRGGNAYYVSPASASSLYSLGVGLAVITPNVYGSGVPGGNLVLGSTNNAPKGKIYIGANSAYDETTGFLGIGTTSPGAAIDVGGGNVRTSAQLVSTVATGTAPLQVTSTTLVGNLNADLLDGKHASDFVPIGNISGTQTYLAKFTGTNSLGNSLLYDNGTNVGIGTATPNAKLEVSGSTAPAILVTSTNYPTSYRTQLGVQPNAQGILVLGNNGTNEIRFGATNPGGAGSIYVNNTADYNSAVNGTLAMSFTSSGTVGIGTFDPQGYTLRVAGTAKIDSTLNVVGGIQINGTTVIDGSSNVTANNVNAKSYQLNGTTIIDASGNLKNIATATITTSLAVPTIYGSSSASGPLYLYSTSNGTLGNIYLNGTTSYFDGSGARLNLQNTAAADYAGVTVTNDGANYLSVYRYGSSAAGTWAGLNKASLSRIASIGGDLFVGTWNGGNLVFGTSLPPTVDSAERMRISQTGQVIVGGVNANNTGLLQVNLGALALLGSTGGYPFYKTTAGDNQFPSPNAAFFWYPAKRAVRAGYAATTEFDDANIGQYSVAMGYDVKASGSAAAAFGWATSATNGTAVAMGNFSTASGNASVAIGDTVIASSNAAVAMGSNATASGAYSLAHGWAVTAGPNSNTFALGAGLDDGTRMVNNVQYSFAVGIRSTIPTLLVTGANNTAGAVGTVQVGAATGTNTNVSTFQVNNGAVAFIGNTGGYPAYKGTPGDNAFPLNTAGLFWYPAKSAFRAGKVGDTSWDDSNIGTASVGLGLNSMAKGFYSVAIGIGTQATGMYSVSIGSGGSATGTGSVTIGGNSAQSDYTFALGEGGTIGSSSTYSLMLANESSVNGSRSLILGNWLAASTSYAFVIGNGAGFGNNLANNVQHSLMMGFNSTVSALFVKNGGTNAQVVINGTSNPTNYMFYVNGTAGGTGTWNQLSDARYKKDISAIENPLAKILALKGVSYDWRHEEYPEKGFDTKRQLGFIAQEVERVLPEIVSTSTDGFKSMAYTEILPVLVEAIKELNAKVIAINHVQLIAAVGSKGQKYEMRSTETLEKLVTVTSTRDRDKDVKGYISVRDVYLADTDKWASENGPKFLQPVTIYEGGSPCEFRVYDISKNLPAGASAVILEVETVNDGRAGAIARIRKGPGAACYNLIRGQGVFPVSQARTFEMAIDGAEGKKIVVKIVGYM